MALTLNRVAENYEVLDLIVVYNHGYLKLFQLHTMVSRAIFTYQDTAMGCAIKEVFTKAWHGLCTHHHIMQNAVKYLCNKKNDEDEESHILTDFSACMYSIEDTQ